MARRRDFMVLPKSRCSSPLSSEVGRRRAAEGTSKDRPEHSDQPNDGQRANNDWLPRADTLWHGKIDLRIGAARKDQTKTLRMIIEKAITATSFGRAVLVAKGESDAPSDYNGVTEIPSFGIAS